MNELKLENLGNQYFEDNEITSLADYVKKVEELYSILEKERVSIILCTFENPSLYEMLT